MVAVGLGLGTTSLNVIISLGEQRGNQAAAYKTEMNQSDAKVNIVKLLNGISRITAR